MRHQVAALPTADAAPTVGEEKEGAFCRRKRKEENEGEEAVVLSGGLLEMGVGGRKFLQGLWEEGRRNRKEKRMEGVRASRNKKN